MKASIAIHVETLWTNGPELTVEANSRNRIPPPGGGPLLFETAQLIACEARAEDERALFREEAMDGRYRELDERENGWSSGMSA